MVCHVDIFTSSKVSNKSLISNIKSTQFGRIKKENLFSYRFKRNNNELRQQDIKIKVPGTVIFMLGVKLRACACNNLCCNPRLKELRV